MKDEVRGRGDLRLQKRYGARNWIDCGGLSIFAESNVQSRFGSVVFLNRATFSVYLFAKSFAISQSRNFGFLLLGPLLSLVVTSQSRSLDSLVVATGARNSKEN